MPAGLHTPAAVPGKEGLPKLDERAAAGQQAGSCQRDTECSRSPVGRSNRRHARMEIEPLEVAALDRLEPRGLALHPDRLAPRPFRDQTRRLHAQIRDDLKMRRETTCSLRSLHSWPAVWFSRHGRYRDASSGGPAPMLASYACQHVNPLSAGPSRPLPRKP